MKASAGPTRQVHSGQTQLGTEAASLKESAITAQMGGQHIPSQRAVLRGLALVGALGAVADMAAEVSRRALLWCD